MTLRIGFNARLLADPSLRGWNRYTINLLAHLPAHGVRPVLYAPRPLHPNHLARLVPGSYDLHVAPPMRNSVWEQVWWPRRAAEHRVDLLHATFNFGLPLVSPRPTVLTLHDAIDPVYYGRRASWRDRVKPASLVIGFQHWLARTRADFVIAVSQHAASDLHKYLRIPPRRMAVTYEAADPHFHRPVPPAAREAVRAKFGLPRDYVFYVGGWEGRKNIGFLLRAFAAANLPHVDLFLAGGNDGQRTGLLALAAELGLAERLKLGGWVDEADLPALYAEALAFAYPSEYEGFGLQLCEAMACGCPTFAARKTCLPEILGDGGDTFTLAHPGELAGELRRAATEPAYRANLQSRARQRSAEFSWDRCAAETAAVYRRVLGRIPTA